MYKNICKVVLLLLVAIAAPKMASAQGYPGIPIWAAELHDFAMSIGVVEDQMVLTPEQYAAIEANFGSQATDLINSWYASGHGVWKSLKWIYSGHNFTWSRYDHNYALTAMWDDASHPFNWTISGHVTPESTQWLMYDHDIPLSLQWKAAGHNFVVSLNWLEIGHSLAMTLSQQQN